MPLNFELSLQFRPFLVSLRQDLTREQGRCIFFWQSILKSEKPNKKNDSKASAYWI